MQEMITLAAHTLTARLAVHPVTCGDFKQFLRGTGRPIPPQLAKQESSSAPATRISQIDALAYCAWLGQREGQVYRLPSMAELEALAANDTAEGIDPGIWSNTPGQISELRGGLKRVYLCEWTLETESVDRPDGAVRVLGSIFYPPWLREGSNATHAQAHLLVTEGYSFVTFRVACDH